MKKGFTLVELLVVVAIIGLLAGIATVSVNSVRSKARDARRVADIKQIQNALELYYSGSGTYPNPGADLTLGTGTALALSNAASGFTDTDAANIGAEVYLNPVPKDPQNTGAFIYTFKVPTGATDALKAAAATKDYSITFQLESGTGSFVSGKYTATSSGLQRTDDL